MRFKRLSWIATLIALAGFCLPNFATAQSVVTGGLTGSITDASGAVVVGATVNLKNLTTDETQTTTTGGSGIFTLSLLKPGDYTITVSHDGFKTLTQTVTVALGQVAVVNAKLETGSISTTVEVTEQGQMLQTENANINTNFDTKQIQEIPNPGGDITYLANTAPGVVANNSTAGGYGNFTAFGLPADANLFTVNGNDYNDPFLNLNNTGSSNLLLGGNELQEIAIVSNGYTGQYGRQAGAQVDYSTKSGSNQFHGDAVYYWTGTALTANDPLNKLGGGTRPFENNNQWAASLGGPIKKNKAFFFINTEGIRYIFGAVHNVTLMTPAFQSYVLGNVPQDPATQAFYQNAFKLYNAAPGIGNAVPNTITSTSPSGSCVGWSPTNLPVAEGACTESYTQSVGNGNREWLLSGRVDYSLSDTDKIFGRVKFDRGVQPTYTDSVNPVFNDNSIQPQDEGQLNYTHIFSPNVVNNFIGSVLYYSAIFGNPNPAAALALFPGNIAFVDGSSTTALGTGSGNPGGFAQGFLYPQGRNVTQWQLIDDLAITRGSHSFKMGINFRRDDVTDFASSTQTEYPAINTTLLGFANDQVFEPANFANTNYAFGGGGNVVYNFAIHTEQPLALYSVGLYFQDEWRASSKLKLTMTLRADRNSSGVCQVNCTTLPVVPFDVMPKGADIPYSAALPNGSFLTGQHSILPNVEKVVFEPRFGFAYTPFGENTVFRGGIGLFTDLYPGEILGNYTTNFPQVNPWNVAAGSLAFDMPGSGATAFPTSGVNLVTQCNAKFTQNYNTAPGNLNSYAALAAGVPGGCISPATGNLIVPSLAATSANTLNPKYIEWSFEMQHSFGNHTSLSINYVGNRGFDELVNNPYANAFCDTASCSTTSGFTNSGLPTAAPDPRLGAVAVLTNAGYSNYNGVTASFQERDWHGLTGRFNYTYSHALDTDSNGGINPFSVITSVLGQINPYNLKADYGSSDYDVRHNLSANYIYALPLKSENRLVNGAIGGWQASGTFFWHSGFPFSILDGATLAGFSTDNLTQAVSSATILAQPVASFTQRNFPNGQKCAIAACFSTADFQPSTNFTGNVVGRNAFRGPGFFGSDFSIRKTFTFNERLGFQLGFDAYNVFNHANYGIPSPNTDGSLGPFGQTIFTATMPTSPYGAFAAAATDQRIAQIQGKLIF
ncbi:MAG: carboxypeptidase regulatory-like domain-containing protein [Candidatus Acidiferrales bacterium]